MASLQIVPISGGVVPSSPAPLPEAPTPPAANTEEEFPITPAEIALCVVEDQLISVVEMLDGVPAEQNADLRAELARVMDTVDGRDKMAKLLTHIEAEPGYLSADIKRLQARKALYDRVLERLEGMLVEILQEKGKDSRGKWPKLAGRVSHFTLKKLPPSVVIDDDAAVPSTYRKATVKLAAPLWEEILDALDMELAGRVMDEAKRSDEVSKTAIKEAIEARVEVPGAHISKDGLKLVRG